ncbi:YdeI family protein [Terriglobus sp. TAA 43]|uniref:YdeI/OmpD-associated family protein n=1 Tax=Terriglobus sp. TAA 43 TaxID=278961 RepID=UPI0018DB2512|nr:YdeI/OmpD-associated family protein [Terriglobus sp. TAA 43]
MATAKKSPTKKPSAQSFDSRIDAQIAKAPEYAKPILEHLRQMVHTAVPEAVEEVKWSRPFFTLNGENLCFMAAFKNYCGFGFWSPKMPEYLQSQGMPKVEGAGSIGQIASVKDLPKELSKYVKYAAELIRKGEAGSAMEGRTRKGTRQEIELPDAFAALLKKSKSAKTNFEALPPSCKREYLEWITTAKKEETRDKRMGETIVMLEAGRRFNDKYRSC